MWNQLPSFVVPSTGHKIGCWWWWILIILRKDKQNSLVPFGLIYFFHRTSHKTLHHDAAPFQDILGKLWWSLAKTSTGIFCSASPSTTTTTTQKNTILSFPKTQVTWEIQIPFQNSAKLLKVQPSRTFQRVGSCKRLGFLYTWSMYPGQLTAGPMCREVQCHNNIFLGL